MANVKFFLWTDGMTDRVINIGHPPSKESSLIQFNSILSR